MHRCILFHENIFNFGFHSSVRCMQVFIYLHLGFSCSDCSLTEEGRYVEKNEHADLCHSFSSRISTRSDILTFLMIREGM